jgi:hypothetical protein
MVAPGHLHFWRIDGSHGEAARALRPSWLPLPFDGASARI